MDASDTDVTEYVWDNRNRLVEVTDSAQYGGPATQAVDYLYDTENRWIGENIDGDGVIDHQTRFTYDGTQIVLQFDKDGEGALTNADLSHRYFWRPDIVDQLIADEQVTSLKEPGEVLWTLTDNQGTVRDLAVYDSDSDTTTIANHRVYSSFGELKSQTNAAVDCLFSFKGNSGDAIHNY